LNRKSSKPPASKQKKAAPWLPDFGYNDKGGKPGASAGKPGAPGRAGQKAKSNNPAKAQGAPPRPGKGRPQPASNPGRKGPMRGHGAADPHAAREAQKYADPIASRESILAFLSDSSELMTAERIAVGLKLTDPMRFEALTKRLTAMVRDGQVLVNRRGGYGVAQKLDLIAGQVVANPDGYGFLRPDDGADDLYLSPFEMRRVLHGDRVLASVIGLDRRGRRQGAIVEVLERRPARIVGRYKEEGGLGLVVPDDRRIHQDLLIAPGRQLGARDGQIVVAEITEPPTKDRPPLGQVLAVLGDRLSASLTVSMAIESHGLPNEWPVAVMREVEGVDPKVPASELAGREDLRAMPLVTIDGEDARDFDDAVYCEPHKGGWRLVVAIADVSHYVRPGTALDDEAQKRGTSVYFPDFVVPMLPESLSNGICSLMPKVDRCCMVADMLIDADGDLLRSRFYPALMRSAARLTYTRVWQAIGEKDADARHELSDVLPHLDRLHALYKVLAKQRRKRGAIEFESREVQFKLAPTGEVLQMGAYERNDAHKLIEECMIAANVAAAQFLGGKRIPAPYRVHARPPADKYEDLRTFLKEFKLSMPPHEQVVPGDFAALVEKVRERPDASLLMSVLLRSQSLAVYHPSNEGHFGLALEAYAHFTSPIRRYPDLLVHRAIRHAIGGGRREEYLYDAPAMEQLAAHCSTCERRADMAERDVDERYRCAWMEKHVGSEFDGVVSGVTSFGLFVELTESGVSGLVHITQLPNDYYHFDPRRHVVKGEKRGLEFRLGDPVRVLVLRASLEERKIDFRLVERQVKPKTGKRG